jgi:hypothetical protein
MKLANEIHLLPDDEGHVLYAPLIHTILRVNEQLVALLRNVGNGVSIPTDERTISVLARLKELGIVDGDETLPRSHRSPRSN